MNARLRLSYPTPQHSQWVVHCGHSKVPTKRDLEPGSLVLILLIASPICPPMWGLLGPVSIRTKRGTRVTFLAGFITIPLTALSLWKLLTPPAEHPKEPQLQPGSRELDLSGK